MLLDRDRLQLLHLCTAWRDGVENAVADEWQGTLPTSSNGPASEPAKVYRAWRDSERRGNYTMTKNQLHAFFDYTLPGCDKYVVSLTDQQGNASACAPELGPVSHVDERLPCISCCTLLPHLRRPWTKPFSSHGQWAIRNACGLAISTLSLSWLTAQPIGPTRLPGSPA